MSRWTVIKYKFRCGDPIEDESIEFIVSRNGNTMSEKSIFQTAHKIMKQIAVSYDDKTSVFNFGSLKVNDFLDDIRKLMLIEYPKAKGMRVQIWYDRDPFTAFWDDGEEKSSLPSTSGIIRETV